jgi:hypothetical protein
MRNGVTTRGKGNIDMKSCQGRGRDDHDSNAVDGGGLVDGGGADDKVVEGLSRLIGAIGKRLHLNWGVGWVP